MIFSFQNTLLMFHFAGTFIYINVIIEGYHHFCFSVPNGLEDVSKYPSLIETLVKKSWTEVDLRKLIGINFLRVLQQVEMVSVDAIRR